MGGGGGEEIKELPPRFLEFPFFYLPIYLYIFLFTYLYIYIYIYIYIYGKSDVTFACT